jgi:hypothetical protein
MKRMEKLGVAAERSPKNALMARERDRVLLLPQESAPNPNTSPPTNIPRKIPELRSAFEEEV